MKNINFKNYSRITMCIILSASLPLERPAIAASNGYSGSMSQLPPAYIPPPSPNVFITLDTSRSMMGDSLPQLGQSLINSGKYPKERNDYETETLDNPMMWLQFTNVNAGSDIIGKLNGISSFLSYEYYNPANPVARYLRSSDGNPLYYNPKITYSPWGITHNGSTYAPANPNEVIIHPYNPKELLTSGSLNNKLDITKAMGPPSQQFWPATYYNYIGTTPFPQLDPLNSGVNTPSNFRKIEIKGTDKYTKYPTRSDCKNNSLNCTGQEELQNFANWLQYYRSRSLMAKSGLFKSLESQDGNIRVGFATVRDESIRLKMKNFTGTDKQRIIDEIAKANTAEGTPLRKITDIVGEYFMNERADGPWGKIPGVAENARDHLWCRRNYHILTTDGLWNGSAATRAVGNNDNLNGNRTPTNSAGVSYQYQHKSSTPPSITQPADKFTIHPFTDSNQDTLSDVTAYYWKNDLRPDLINNLSPTSRDPAFWQHLTTYTIGMGIGASGKVKVSSTNTEADLSTQASRGLLIGNQTELNWPSPANDNDPSKGDDLIHAAISSRGEYFQANNADSLNASLKTIFSEIPDQLLQGAGLETKSLKMSTDNILYQATLNPSGWQGRIYAFRSANSLGFDNRPSTDNYTNSNQVWEASNKMPSPENRKIYTKSPRNSLDSALIMPANSFTFANLNDSQKISLNNDPKIVDYLRGSDKHEISNGGLFRNRIRYTVNGVRGGVLGDIVNSSPLKGPENGGGYDRIPGKAGENYIAFRNANTILDDMKNTLFVGANDGMFHAFNLSDGIEKFAYVPYASYEIKRTTGISKSENRLAFLSDPAYNHRFTVDGPPNIGDALINNKWKSILVASNGAGARGVFSIDVTDTKLLDGNNFKWELTDEQDPDIGFVPGYPHVVQMRNKKWAAIFGNGPDSSDGKAILYIVGIDDGKIIKKMSVDTSGQNGLMQPNFLLNNNREVTTIYAGDLKGNMWKFDVDSPDTGKWNTGSQTNNSKPIFSAVGKTGNAQPITVMPEITAHPKGGVMLVFGTGKFFEVTDTKASLAEGNLNFQGQSIYGIWDKPLSTDASTPAKIVLTKDNRESILKNQTFTITPSTSIGTANFSKSIYNIPDWSKQSGWFMDFSAAKGDLININPQQVRDVVFLVVNTPRAESACTASGSSIIIALDPVTGANPSKPKLPVFDTNNDGKFDDLDGDFNVKLNSKGILTRPIFTIPDKTPDSIRGSNYNQPYSIFDRGQASAARPGGVELGRAPSLPFGAVGTPNPCVLSFNSAAADTSLEQINVQVCQSGPPRTSWRQLQMR